jgi:hypothetical protein
LSKLFDPIRQTSIAALPEEHVRQSLLLHMLKLGFPKGNIAVEKELQEFAIHKMPKRRIDILVFSKKDEKLFPLLMIECKANQKLTSKVIEQVLGYNFFVKAYFVGIANENEFKLFWQERNNERCSLDFLPTYAELLKAIV